MNSTLQVTSSLLIRNSIYSIIAKIITVGIGFFIIPFMILHLGLESYGIWILIGSIFRYRDVFSLGLNSAINRYIPHFNAGDEFDKIEKVVNTSLIFYIFTSILFVIASLAIHHYLTDWFVIPDQLQTISKTLVLIVGLGFAFIIPLNLYSAVLSSYQRYDILNIGIITHVLFRAILLIFLLVQGYGLIIVGIVFTISEIGLKVVYFYYGRKFLKSTIRFSFAQIDFKLLKEMLGYGFNTFLFTISAVMIYRASDMIIGIYKNVGDVAKYSIVTMIILMLHQLLQAFLAVIKPAISDLNARENSKTINEIALLSQKYSLFFLIPSSMFFILFGKEFLSIWVGENFSNLNLILTILIIGNFLYLAQYSNFFILVGKGEHKIFGILAIITAILTIALSVLSLSILKLDLISVAISTAIPLIFVSGIILQLYFNNKMNISIIDNAKLSWIPALIGCFPTVIVLIGLKFYFSTNNWINVAVIIVIAVISTVFGVWYFGLKDIEKRRLLNFFKLKA